MEIQFAFDKDSPLQKKLDAIYKATGDLTIPLKLMAREWFKANRSIFKLKSAGRYKDLSTRPLYTFWEKEKRFRRLWEGGYKEYKQARWGFVYPILKRTGRLMESITNAQSSESINQIESDKRTLVLGTRVPYGIYHQSNEARSKIPYRPFLLVGVEQIAPQDIKQERVKGWIRMLDDYFQQVVDRK